MASARRTSARLGALSSSHPNPAKLRLSFCLKIYVLCESRYTYGTKLSKPVLAVLVQTGTHSQGLYESSC